MKNWLIILTLFILPGFAFAQDEEDTQEGGKIPERMKVYIQNKLGLSRKEADRFAPVFFRYFREFAKTHRENRGDRLILQQKIIELSLGKFSMNSGRIKFISMKMNFASRR
jgi:hypothetical protein